MRSSVAASAIAVVLALGACDEKGTRIVDDGSDASDATVAGDASAARDANCAGAVGALAKPSFHGDRARTGSNPNETALTPAAIAGPSFGSTWSSATFDVVTIGGQAYPGRTYASPLYVDATPILGGVGDGRSFDVLFAATSNGYVYAVNAFDAPAGCDGAAVAAGTILWRAQVGHAVVVPKLDSAPGFPGIALGVLGTPVIDRDADPPRIYVASMDGATQPIAWRLYALDLRSGALLPGWPVALTPDAVAPVANNGPALFDPDATGLSQRSALNVSQDGHLVYVPFGGFADDAVGWILAVDTRTPKVAFAYASAPDPVSHVNAGIWGPGGPAIDAAGNVFQTTGNGAVDWIGKPNGWGQSFLRWTPELQLAGTYTPWNWCASEMGDTDLGGDTPILLDLLPSETSTPSLAAFGSKQGTVYLVDRAHLPGRLDQRPPCSTQWNDPAHDGSLLPPTPQPQYCNPRLPGACVTGPLSVFGPYSDDASANNTDHAKMRTTPAYLRGPNGEHWLFVSGTTKVAVDPPDQLNLPPSLARLRVNTTPGQPAYLSIEAEDKTLVFVNPGSPFVSSNGSADAVVWVLDENAFKSQALLDPNTPHPVLYAVDAMTMRPLWTSAPNELDVGGKYGEPVVAHGSVFVTTDRVQAFGLRDRSTTTPPPPRTGQHLIYDERAGVVVMVDGTRQATLYDDMWQLDGMQWSALHPVVRPPPRYDGSFAYDAAHGVGVLFGGSDGSSALGDTWLWDGATWSNAAAAPALAPLPRVACSVTYDAARGVELLFGGRDNTSTGFYNDTWTWDGTVWTQLAPPVSPSPRVIHTMAFDAAHGNVVLFGGRDAPVASLADTWTWDGTNWTQQHPATSPSARFDYGMGYDAVRANVILFGGESMLSSPSPFGDTWMWDGTTWTELHPAHSPSPRIVHGLVWDAKNQQLVLVSGENNVQFFADAWGWNGNDWVAR
jgi:hypothetical protein